MASGKGAGGVQSRGLIGRLRGWCQIPLAGVLSVIGGLLLWEFVSRYLVANALFLAGPSQIFRAIVTLARTASSGATWRSAPRSSRSDTLSRAFWA